MSEAELYQSLEYILNQATDKEIEVIIEAIKKRSEGNRGSVLSGMNVGKMSRNIASSIQDQLSMPLDGIRKMVREMVVKMIKQNVPDIPEEHLEVLLQEWVPEPGQKKPVQAAPSAPTLPPDVMLTMVKHFTKYSTGAMSPGEQLMLKQANPEWFDTYWSNFPKSIKILLNSYLKGHMSAEDFWSKIKADLK